MLPPQRPAHLLYLLDDSFAIGGLLIGFWGRGCRDRFQFIEYDPLLTQLSLMRCRICSEDWATAAVGASASRAGMERREIMGRSG
jgi:hypothetical protein